MNITINGKEYTLEFGLKFIREMDKAYTIETKGMTFAMGIESAMSYLSMKNPIVLYEIIKAGTSHLKSKPSSDEIEDALTKIAEEDKLDKFYKDVQKAMEEAPFLKSKIKEFKKNAKTAEE